MRQIHRDRGPVENLVRRHADAIMCRAAALPLMVALLFFPKRFPAASLAIGRAYAMYFWRARGVGEWLDIAAAILVWPFGVFIAALWFTYHNGPIIAERTGRSVIRQFGDQLCIAVTTGLLPPWYYIFELYRPGGHRMASSYVTRGQTKRGIYRFLAETRGSVSPLNDKDKFASYCAERQVAAVPVLVSAQNGMLLGAIRTPDRLAPIDLFMKPTCSRGGRGAERWDYLTGEHYRRVDGVTLSAAQFLDRLRRMSLRQPFIVQERVRNHPAIVDLSNGALNTIRVLSCLNERQQPEVIAAVLRMAVGHNVTVDNVHAGGLAAAVDLASGTLSRATDMGVDARLGWIDRHPDTGAAIAGRTLPLWDDALALVRRAHAAFDDWIVVGWDVAILRSGPWLIEGNCGPDIDLVQRPLRAPFGNGRFGELLAFHIQQAPSPRATNFSRPPASSARHLSARAASRR